jgi:hypothetical protein
MRGIWRWNVWPTLRTWPWIGIVTLIVIPLTLWWVTDIGRQESWDLSLVEKFKETHSDKDEYRRRLSPYLIRQIKDAELQRQLRQFVFWDVVERHFTGQKIVDRFRGDDQDWHLLGDAMLDRKMDDDHLRRWWRRWHCWRCWVEPDFLEWWREYKRLVCKRWPERGQVLEELYRYLDEWYFGDDWDKQCPIQHCLSPWPKAGKKNCAPSRVAK